VQSAELGAVAPTDRTQSPTDLFLIFVGANVVATTLQVGATMAGQWTFAQATTVILIGSMAGAALVAALAPLGPKLGVPSIVASRAAMGF
jgi:purine-cytosine permease-like protein